MNVTFEHATKFGAAGNFITEMGTRVEFVGIDKKLDPWFLAPHFWVKVPAGKYVAKNLHSFEIELKAHGLKGFKINGGNSEVEEYTRHIENDRSIRAASPLAGRLAGPITSGPDTILITQDRWMLEPKQGDWSRIKHFVDLFMGASQTPHFMSWHANTFRNVYKGTWGPMQLLVLAGGVNCGKSFWQMHVLSKVFGPGQDPYKSLSTEGFNGELASAVHLCMEDVQGDDTLRTRETFGKGIKQYTSNPTRRFEGKGVDALSAQVVQFMSLSVNARASRLSVLPPLETDFADKVMLFRCGQAAVPTNFGFKAGDRAGMEAMFAEELPAFLHYLLFEYEIPEAIRADRWGVEAYRDKDLAESIIDLGETTSHEILDLIDRAVFDVAGNRDAYKELTAIDWVRELRKHGETEELMYDVLPRNNPSRALARAFQKLVGLGEGEGGSRVSKQPPKRSKLALWRVTRYE